MRCLLLAALAASGLGCFPQGDDDLPGEVVGEFEVVGLMVEQSCGGAIAAQDPLDLAFELRLEENGRAFYRLPTGLSFAGTESDGRYTFQVSQSWMVLEPDPFRGFDGCSVTQRDVFTFQIEEPAAGSGGRGGEGGSASRAGGGGSAGGRTPDDPTSVVLTGSQTTDITPLSGSDCRPAVAALGGPFLSLPCRVEYVLTGNGI